MHCLSNDALALWCWRFGFHMLMLWIADVGVSVLSCWCFGSVVWMVWLSDVDILAHSYWCFGALMLLFWFAKVLLRDWWFMKLRVGIDFNRRRVEHSPFAACGWNSFLKSEDMITLKNYPGWITSSGSVKVELLAKSLERPIHRLK